jgi:hypothetical protein
LKPSFLEKISRFSSFNYGLLARLRPGQQPPRKPLEPEPG